MKIKMNIRAVTFIAVMSALSTVLYLVLPEIPIVPGIDYLKIDFSDIPAIIAGVTFGPLSGVCVEVVKNALHLFRSTTLGVGEVINVGVGAAIIVALYLFSRLFSRVLKKNGMSAPVYYLASIGAIAAAILAGWILNAVLTPLYFSVMGIPTTSAAVLAGVWGSTLLNAVKAAFNLLPFFPVYYALNKAFAKIYS